MKRIYITLGLAFIAMVLIAKQCFIPDQPIIQVDSPKIDTIPRAIDTFNYGPLPYHFEFKEDSVFNNMDDLDYNYYYGY